MYRRHGKMCLHKLVISSTSCCWLMPVYDWLQCRHWSIRGWQPRLRLTASCCDAQSARTWWNASRRDRATSLRVPVGQTVRHTRSGLSTGVSARRRLMHFTVTRSSRLSCLHCLARHVDSLMLMDISRHCRKSVWCQLPYLRRTGCTSCNQYF